MADNLEMCEEINEEDYDHTPEGEINIKKKMYYKSN